MNNELNNELEKYSTEELKAELKRRFVAARLAKVLEMKTAHRCRNCVHCVEKISNWCIFHQCAVRTYTRKNEQRNYMVALSQKACDKFELKK